MSLLSFNNVGQSYGDIDIFSNASASLANGGKVGIVGPNGVGKTTLLLALAGQSEPSRGDIHLTKGTKVGYLTQEATHAFANKANPLYDEMLTVFDGVRQLERDIADTEDKMSRGDQAAETLEAYAKLLDQLEAAGGYNYEQQVKRTLTGLGFRPNQYTLTLDKLSGGQKTRALLARLLLEKPDLLFLDEPTNHLDIEAVEWLEGMLKTWEGAVVIVSHDRAFLDNTVSLIWELSATTLEAFRGNYSAYVMQREERWLDRQRLFDQMMDKFLKELDYVKRNIARDSTKDQAVGRLKRLIRQVKMAQVGGPDSVMNMSWAKASAKYGISGTKWEVPDVERALKQLPRPSGRRKEASMGFREGGRSGKLVLRTEDLKIGYGESVLFSAEDIELHRLERVALIGPNGCGKSTFLKTLLGQIEPVAGKMNLGASLKLGYFAQAHDGLNLDNSVLDEFMRHHGMLPAEARNYLGRYLFSGEDVFQKVSSLSGGERGRLALAILSLHGANFLLLDEPTNHLDIPAQEALQEVLAQFDGTILMVSHDRYLIDQLATQVWAVAEGRMRITHGGYQAYLADRSAATVAAAPVKKVDTRANGTSHDKPSALSKNELWRKQQALAQVEADIESAETELAQLTELLQTASASGDYDRLAEATEAFGSAEKQLEQLMEQWATLTEAIEA